MLRSPASQAYRLSIKSSSNNSEYIIKYQRVKLEHEQKGGEYFQQTGYLQSSVNCLCSNHDYSVEVSQMLIRDRVFQLFSDQTENFGEIYYIFEVFRLNRMCHTSLKIFFILFFLVWVFSHMYNQKIWLTTQEGHSKHKTQAEMRVAQCWCHPPCAFRKGK